jgi:ABC-2 type transport system permease protein
MNTQLNAMPQSLETHAAPAVSATSTRPFYWSLRREVWENRSLYLALLAVAAVVLLGFLLHVNHLPRNVRTLPTLNPMQQHEVVEQPFDIAAGLLMGTFLIVALFYCVDALYGERRDRSILFWKSLPVSDLTTVLAKATIPLLVLPLLTFAITIVTQLIMVLISAAVLVGSGQSFAAFWSQLSFLRMSMLLLYHLFTVHVLWEAPIYAWLLLASAWARRAAFLWGVLPPFAVCVLEKMLFNTSHFAHMLEYRLSGGLEAVTASDTMPMNPMTHLTPFRFLGAPGLWIGLCLAAVFLAAAVRLRRYRGPA